MPIYTFPVIACSVSFSEGVPPPAAALIECVAEGTPANDNMPGQLRIHTNPGQAAQEERIRITKDGNVGIGTTSPSTVLEVKDSTDTGLTITAGNTSSQSRLLFSDGTVDANVSYDHNDRKLYLGTASSSGLDGDLVIAVSYTHLTLPTKRIV